MKIFKLYKRKQKRILKGSLLILFLVLVLILHRYIPYHDKGELLDYFDEISGNKNIGFTFIIITIFSSILCIPISWLKALAGAYFGVEKAFFYSMISATISCGVSFMIARILGQDIVNHIYNKHFSKKLSIDTRKYLEKINDFSSTHIFILRNIYFFPFALTNYLLGVTTIPFKKYMLASTLGMLPGTFIYTFFFSKITSCCSSN
ncbi:TVP38/TMEM64 family protein [Serpentinicella alkaliphila]|uniref:TVP38/TMEM64 family membrane protein n=1 Tax=Serpentinicella alkaliphila TaxID=1734049 RepID=A0A4R2T7Y9_9FIRM|nr:VTT domain-containing protein [Serpentinicella alkaliphila]QUH25716.1 VTT domain-containing protein [Serpentinicella alkaliphila]TCP93288.1 putative membrane protein YdjX (TVP38/TMEM64 family) [Serpentinicella alkaliphila]